MVYAGVGQHIMLSGPLHGSLIEQFNTRDKFQWVPSTLRPIRDKAHLEFTPNDNADFALIAVVQAASPPYSHASHRQPCHWLRPNSLPSPTLCRTRLAGLYQDYVFQWSADVALPGTSSRTTATRKSRAANWLRANLDLLIVPDGEHEDAPHGRSR